MANIIGTDAGEVLVGTADADYILGKRGNDTIFGNAGDDFIVERTGDDEDIVDGGDGFDTAYLTNGDNSNIASLYLFRREFSGPGEFVFQDSPPQASSSDTVNATFKNVEHAYFAFGNIRAGIVLGDLTGSGLQSIYINHSGTLSLIVTSAAMTVPITAFAGSGEANLTGGGGDDILVAGTGRATMDGGAGNDFLSGSSLNDSLNGGSGLDTLVGGAGDDTYYVDSRFDTAYELSNQGVDTVVSFGTSYFLPANVENLEFLADSVTGIGNDLANRIIGSSFADTLVGEGGNDRLESRGGLDTLLGGVGDDTYVVDNSSTSAVEYANEGTDLVLTSSTLHQLSANLENLTYSGTGPTAFTGIGNDLDNVLTGGVGADTLVGQGGADRLVGGAGGDLLDGGAGNDRLEGGVGADNLYGSTGADVFVATVLQDGIDLIHDFARGEGDKIDITILLAAIGKSGSEAFAQGYLTLQPVGDYNGLGPATRVLFDPDGSAGVQGQTTFLASLGSDPLIQSDFIG